MYCQDYSMLFHEMLKVRNYNKKYNTSFQNPMYCQENMQSAIITSFFRTRSGYYYRVQTVIKDRNHLQKEIENSIERFV